MLGNSIARFFHPPPSGGDQRWLTVSLSWLVAIIAVGSIAMRFVDREMLYVLAREDGPYEDFEAVAYFLAAFSLLYVVAGRGVKNVWVLGIAVLFFLVGGEEISWGQRIFAIGTPETMREINVQGETNIHNIEGLHQIVRALSLLILWCLFVAIPLGTRFRATGKLVRALGLPVANWGCALAVVVATAFMIVPRLFGHIDFHLDEVGELLISIAALGLAIGLWSASRPGSVPKSEYVEEGVR